MRAKFAPKAQALQERIRRAESAKQAQSQQSMAAKLGAAASVGSAILSMVFGRKALSASSVSKAATAVRAGGRVMKESGDVGRAEETVESLQSQLKQLEADIEAEAASLGTAMDVSKETFKKLGVRPKKTGINVRAVVLAWTPMWVDGAGARTEAWC
jgi:hypothetical protein